MFKLSQCECFSYTLILGIIIFFFMVKPKIITKYPCIDEIKDKVYSDAHGNKYRYICKN